MAKLMEKLDRQCREELERSIGSERSTVSPDPMRSRPGTAGSTIRKSTREEFEQYKNSNASIPPKKITKTSLFPSIDKVYAEVEEVIFPGDLLPEPSQEEKHAKEIENNKDMAEAREHAYREKALSKVHRAFDLSGDGNVERSELAMLGSARRELGDKETGTWTKVQNERVLRIIDTDGNDLIDSREFIKYFEDSLPRDREAHL